MAIPNYETIMRPLLIQISDGKGYTRIELAKKLSKHFNLSVKEEKTILPSGGETIFKNRVGWANFHLKKAGLTENKSKGIITITEEGLKAIEAGKIDKNFLMKYPEYQKFYRKK